MLKGRLVRRPSSKLLILQHLHVLCLPTLRALDDIELHWLAFLQAAKTVRLNCGEMDENILAIFPADKAITFRVIEPLHCSLFHCVTRIPYFMRFALFVGG